MNWEGSVRGYCSKKLPEIVTAWFRMHLGHTHGWRKKLVQNRQACPELNVVVPWLLFETLEITGSRTFLRKLATSCVSALVWDSFKR
jgi:hypothetical protein